MLIFETWDVEENQRRVESTVFWRKSPQNYDNGLIQAHCIAMQNQSPQPRTKVKGRNISTPFFKELDANNSCC